MILKSSNKKSNDVSALRNLVCFNFYRGWRGISEYYRKSLPAGISPQQSYMLEICDINEGVQVSYIANMLEIDISAVSGMLRRMEIAKLIRREVQPDNRRQVLVYLTAEGEDLKIKATESMLKADAALSAAISQPMMETLIEIVDRIRKLE
jgi:DNA-binding MarR family transcriptional regulator